MGIRWYSFVLNRTSMEVNTWIKVERGLMLDIVKNYPGSIIEAAV